MSVSLEMKYYTCSTCGLTYGYPQHFSKSFCPMCVDRERDHLQDRRNDDFEEICKLEKTISGLKGALTRARKKS